MAEGHTCRRCARDAEPGMPLCSECYLQMAGLEAMETCRRLELTAAIEESKRAVLN